MGFDAGNSWRRGSRFHRRDRFGEILVFGVTEEEAIERLIDLLSTGMWHVPAVSQNKRIRRRGGGEAATPADPLSSGYLAGLIASPLSGAK